MNTSIMRNLCEEALAIHERQLPSVLPHVDGIDCFCQSLSAGRAGGDFFDLVSPNRRQLTVAVGTLSAKGLAGSILLTGLQATLHSLASRDTEVSDIACELNQTLWHIAPENTFAGLFSARVRPSSREIQFVNAGHEAALIVRHGGRMTRLEPQSPVLGLSRRSEYPCRTVGFEPGDTLVAITEGAGEGACRILNFGVPERARDLPARIIEAAEPTADRTVVVVHFQDTGRRPVRCLPSVPLRRMAAAA
jgi:sigma-B regulation protein RsbU (phosphoserine phosphatase)